MIFVSGTSESVLKLPRRRTKAPVPIYVSLLVKTCMNDNGRLDFDMDKIMLDKNELYFFVLSFKVPGCESWVSDQWQ